MGLLLRTFGPPALLAADGDRLLGQHGHHRRRLAVLAVLAAAGEHGRSRDQLLLLFWPDATQSRARHSLDQLLYALRSSLGESVFDGVNPVRLNADVITSDIGAFNAAIERGDLEAAVNQYRAPFLDGFYLSDAPEFELWAESERRRLAASYAGALERLAHDAATAEDHPTAVRRWRTLVESDPVSSKNAAGLIGALVNAGDHTAALQYAKVHEARVVQELGVGAGSAVSALVDEVRANARVVQAAPVQALQPEKRESASADVPVDHAPSHRTVRRRSTQVLIAVLAAAAVVTVAMLLRPTWRANTASSVARAVERLPYATTLAAFRHGSTSNIAAHELSLRGADPALMRSDSGARAGLEYFRQAIALDPSSAAAYAGLARLQLRIAMGNDVELPRRERLALAEQAARKAIALDDSLADAHAMLGLLRRSNYDLATAEKELMRAMALDPTNAQIREWLVQLYIVTDRQPRALVEAQRARELDPLSPTANAEFAHALLANNRCDEALAQLEQLRSLRPPLLRAGSFTAQCYANKKMWPQAIAEMRRIAPNAGPRGQAMLGYMLARAGHIDEARQILGLLLDREIRNNNAAFEVATVYSGLGETDRAFAWLDKSLDDRSLGLDNLMLSDEIRADPRFLQFQKRWR